MVAQPIGFLDVHAGDEITRGIQGVGDGVARFDEHGSPARATTDDGEPGLLRLVKVHFVFERLESADDDCGRGPLPKAQGRRHLTGGDTLSKADIDVHLLLGHARGVVDDFRFQRLPAGSTASFRLPLSLFKGAMCLAGCRRRVTARRCGITHGRGVRCRAAVVDRPMECDEERVNIGANQLDVRMGGEYGVEIVPVTQRIRERVQHGLLLGFLAFHEEIAVNAA